MEGYPKDQDLIRRALEGDMQAFEKIVERHQHAVFRIVYRLLKDIQEAEDVTQDTFLRCYQQLHRYDLSRPFTPWLYRIATNLALSRLRRKSRHRLIPWGLAPRNPESKSDEPNILKACPEEELLNKEARQEVLHALKSLKPVDQTVIILRYFEELSYEEIALILRTRRNNIEVRLSRARRQLRQLIKKAADPGGPNITWKGGIKHVHL